MSTVIASADMAKPKTAERPEVIQTAFRAPAEMLDALDAWAEKLNEATHARWSRNAIILAIVERALRERADKGEAP